MRTTLVLFTSDLRVHDNPALHAASRGADAVVPLFVRDDGVSAAGFAAPNRLAFLADSLRDLDAALRARGGRLVVRSGPVVDEVCRAVDETGAAEVHLAAGVSGYAQARERGLASALDGTASLHVHDAAVTAVPAGEVVPKGGDHYAVFTPYFRRWRSAHRRTPLPPPRSLRTPGLRGGPLPERPEGCAPRLPDGGEEAARSRVTAWLRGPVERYAELGDSLAADATSRLSPHLHFGTVSAVELAHKVERRLPQEGAEAFLRQLAWRDFHHQVLAARPAASWHNYREKDDRWRRGKAAEKEAAAWRAGRTGYPVIDAAMRQLAQEGWMHNRARLLTASFLTKTLYHDWRSGAAHFLAHLVDGDVANNQLNWQWAAGTGTDTRPNRVLNPLTQARRLDPDGAYVRRWVPELSRVEGRAAHRPWELSAAEREELGAQEYPERIVDLGEGQERFRAARGLE
ncbi:cryptochrome/photolyase family protein [Streptomyces xiaopingdaonensis]|uniref:cryptochrome/photolyase family protein n=1 Tax=Streptomyces xiaopingdaonensis TaxID=1565415 RepID=UPI0003604710|nr:deoxyribodipyrimidine photo-lyase [Streptomyces xiaopingdaonensis]